MENLYGFKEKDVKALAEFLKTRKNEPLTEVFRLYAAASGKEAGTIRNLYYAMAKKSAESEEFRKKYLSGKRIRVNAIKNFTKEETREIMEKILLKKSEGKSVRKAVGELSKGNMKLALRYQNKYRSALSDEELVKEMESRGFNTVKGTETRGRKALAAAYGKNRSDALLFLKKENAELKKRLSRLRRINDRLSGKEKKDKNL